MFNNYFLNFTRETLIIAIADDILCNNFPQFGYKKTKQNQMELIEKTKYFTFDSRYILVCT